MGIPWKDLGRDWSGVDCWGARCLVFREELGIELPAYSDSYMNAADVRTLKNLIAGAAREGYDEIAEKDVQPFDAVLMRIEGSTIPCHIGTVTRSGMLLHADRMRGTVVQPYKTGLLSHRVIGFFRQRGE